MLSAVRVFHRSYSWKKLLIPCLVAFIIRSAVFYYYVQHEERYRQADSNDYHHCALFIALGNGMSRIDNNQPIFWRTPLYPWYLSKFYKFNGITSGAFAANIAAIKQALWIQIALSSLVPLLIFYLALLLTGSIALSWIAAWISVFHLGFILASTFLLTEALSLLFFILFLFFFYRSFTMYGESKSRTIKVGDIILAALNLAIYTWIRPNGQFLAVVAIIILLFAQASWRDKFVRGILVFALVFWGAISPWYIRNYNLTGQWFYCPMFGPYIHAFCAPRALAKETGKDLNDCLKYLGMVLHGKLMEEQQRVLKEGMGYHPSRELVALNVALPILKKYPWYVAQDWVREVCNTGFDMYCPQLVRFANNTYQYDPPIEYITDKYKDSLYRVPMPCFMRSVCYADFIFTIWEMLGLLGGLLLFLIMPLFRGFNSDSERKMSALWLKTGLMIGALICMTGGYGYARLRLPVEPLMIILALTFWIWIVNFYSNSRK
jgi:hypothetical protein